MESKLDIFFDRLVRAKDASFKKLVTDYAASWRRGGVNNWNRSSDIEVSTYASFIKEIAAHSVNEISMIYSKMQHHNLTAAKSFNIKRIHDSITLLTRKEGKQ